MADSTPLLLPQSDNSCDCDYSSSDLNVDEIIEKSIGGFGSAQLLQSVLVSLAYLFDSQQAFMSVFTDAVPSWHCNNSSSTICTPSSNICRLPKSEWSWDVPSDITIVTEWDLQCASSFLSGLPASSFFLGSVLGALTFSILADSLLGRKRSLLFSCLIMSVAAFVTAFSTDIWMYSAFRLISGFGRASVGTCLIVLLMEKVGKEWRGRVTFGGFFCFALGFLSLPAIAYLNKDSSWRSVYLWTSVPAIIYCALMHFFVYESPRWLFLQGRREEAVAVLEKISSASPCKNYLEHVRVILGSNIRLKHETGQGDYLSSMKKLFTKRWARNRMLIVLGLACCLGLVYYGIPLGVGDLGFNIYLSAAFNALIEMPSAFVVLLFVERWNRNSSVFTLLTIGAISCGICAITGSGMKWVEIGFELLAFFCVCASTNLLSVVIVELFPTSIRNLTTALVRQSQVFGAVFGPQLISAGRKTKLLTYGVFGVVMMFAGILLLFLPETRGKKLCETMEEEEEVKKGENVCDTNDEQEAKKSDHINAV